MKAFVYQVENGTEQLPGTVTPAYRSLWALLQWVKRTQRPGTYNTHVYTDWDRRYGAPSFTVQLQVTEKGL